MANSISIKRHVEFHETDMAGIVHFSNYFRWMESAEAEFFKKLKVPITTQEAAIISGWPKVEAHCTFTAPLRFQDEIEILLMIKEVRNHSISYEFQFFKIENNTKTQVAKGGMITVFAKFNLLENTMSAALLEEELKNKILQTFEVKQL